MSQQNIDFGTFPDDPDADAIRTAFTKVQNNFDELFATATAGSVVSINGGAGIAVNTPTGNVIVTANLAQVVVSTSSLSVGQGSNGGTTAVINSSIQTLVIDINPANVFSGNFSGLSGALANFTGRFTANSNSQPNITSVGTLSNLSVTGNLTAGNVYANSGTIGATTLTGSLTTVAQGNITSVGILTSLSVSGQITNGNITTGANTTAGNITGNWALTAGSQLTATYADLAEYYEADRHYKPGTVLAFGGEKEVTIADSGTTKVAGIVSTNPAYVMNSSCPGEHTVALALQGRVPCHVRGSIKKGDMLISAGNGFAHTTPFPVLGTVIGKSLENFDGIEGIIEVAVGRL